MNDFVVSLKSLKNEIVKFNELTTFAAKILLRP